VSVERGTSILIPIADAGSRDEFGGKSANLAFLTTLGLAVPPGRVVPAAEFTRQLASCATPNELATHPLRSELVAELRELVSTLGGRVSVRSSATLEDAKTHSFAGQFRTVLDVGADGIEAAVRSVWASTFTDNVRAYLRRADLDPSKLKMAVVIQRQIDSEASGVAMGRSGGIIVEAVFGQGEGLVSGAVSADHWEVERRAIVSTKIASKASRIGIPAGPPTGEVTRIELTGAERTKPSLTEGQVLEVAAACERIASACDGRPQDCEFAFAGGTLHMLQTRDVTASLPVTAPPLAEFKPPAKGAWSLDMTHFQRPCTPIFQELFPPAMKAGFSKGLARYGALLSHVDFAFVNGFPYSRMRPLAAPEDATTKAPPPAWLFKLLLKVIPPLRRRIKIAERIWENREWRTQLAEWQVDKASAIKAHIALQSVDLDALDDRGLVAHFKAACEHVSRMVEQHHVYTMATLVPLGDLVGHVKTWSDGKASDADVFALMTGASPISSDLTCGEARTLGNLLATHGEAAALLRLSANSAVISERDAEDALAKLRALGGEIGPCIREFLSLREYRLVEGLDPGDPCLRECPSLLWQALRSTTLAAKASTDATVEAQALARIRASIPADKHAELDSMIAEARALASIRDERALFSDVWAWGILRTTMLAIGRRLIKRSPALLCDPSDLVHARRDEIISLLEHSRGPSAVELETRAAFRRAYTNRDAPATLGPKELPPPSPTLLPAGVGRVMAAVMHVIPHVLSPRREQGDDGMRGSAASSGVWEGPAHIVNSHDDAKDIPAGAVLVVSAGSSAFTMLAPLASAVVSEGGGLLSHVAIVCREYRIPCVCGVSGVLATVQTGQRIRVDGTRGVVDVVAG
jgi:pyruvate,water dikinase